MKKHSTLLLFTSLFSANALFSQPVFQKTYTGGSNITGSYASPATSGIIVAASTTSAPVDAILMKTDLSGTLSWSKSYGGSGDDVFQAVKLTSDGGYIAAGYTTSSGAGGKDALLVKTDASGNVTWSKTYGTVDDEQAFDVIQTTDGGYAFTGSAKIIPANTSVGAISLIKTSSTGVVTWSNMWGAGGGNYGKTVMQTADGGYLVGGRASNGFFSLIKTTSLGVVSWARSNKPLTLQSVDCYQLIATSDGGYALLGSGDDSGNDLMIAFVKTDPNGIVTMSKTYNPGGAGVDLGFGIAQTSGGGYLILGYSSNFPPNFGNLYILTTSAAFAFVSAKTTTAINYG
ncbi:MAG: hypothetical protein ACHQF2_07920, partial [Flavobacteriales bacterium]